MDPATRLATVPRGIDSSQAGMALVSDRQDAAFRKYLATRRWNLRAVDRVTGLDYSASGGHLILTLYDLERR